jgi:protein arginine kinase activator
MNKCHYCGRTATVHLTDIVNKTKREMHLCEACAKQHHLVPDGPVPQLDLQALVKLIMGQPATPGELTCPACGLKYAAFRADGRLGCPDDYDAFRPALEPLLARIHRADAHAGKAPRAVRRARRAERIDELRRRMAAAARAEDYEEAARLRDAVRLEEAADEPG